MQTKVSVMKRNLLGCFVGQNLPHVRHGSAIFTHLRKFASPFESGKFTPEEDAAILVEVRKNGENPGTWNRLAKALNRSHKAICKRFTIVLKNHFTIGRWSIHEHSVLIEHFFQDKKQLAEEIVHSLTASDFKEVSLRLNRAYINVYNHWLGYLKPVLLDYHSGSLYKNFKSLFFDYLIEKKVTATQEIDWREVERLFSTQNSKSLGILLQNVLQGTNLSVPIYKRLESLRPFQSEFSAKTLKFRDQLVELYDQIRGISD